MIYLISNSKNQKIKNLVYASLLRSFTHSQVRCAEPNVLNTCDASILIFISPDNCLGEAIQNCFKNKNVKIVIFGSLPSNLLTFFGFKYVEWNSISASANAAPAPRNGISESGARISYTSLAMNFGSFVHPRPFERFDFADEWNNMGYGAIKFVGDIWSLSQPVRAPRISELSYVEIEEKDLVTYSSIFNSDNSACIWINREAGCIDSYEWVMIEHYVASWRGKELPCSPVLCDVPWGYDAAVTMRLDCDEDIESARSLMLSYSDWGVPFSLAVTTANLKLISNHSIIREVYENGGSILSHTDTHAANWGGSYEKAYEEAVVSSKKIKSVMGEMPKYAVSPFHHSPQYALQALFDAGYSGCIGGIIKNDPEFILARGGNCAGIDHSFVGHTQQVMLHGDCMLNNFYGDEISVYKSSFDLAAASGSIFGYLDHPFSSRYKYGWSSEDSRINVHNDLIKYIRSKKQKIIFMSENQAMDHIRSKNSIDISFSGAEIKFSFNRPNYAMYDFKAIYKDNSYRISKFESINL